MRLMFIQKKYLEKMSYLLYFKKIFILNYIFAKRSNASRIYSNTIYFENNVRI